MPKFDLNVWQACALKTLTSGRCAYFRISKRLEKSFMHTAIGGTPASRFRGRYARTHAMNPKNHAMRRQLHSQTIHQTIATKRQSGTNNFNNGGVKGRSNRGNYNEERAAKTRMKTNYWSTLWGQRYVTQNGNKMGKHKTGVCHRTSNWKGKSCEQQEGSTSVTAWQQQSCFWQIGLAISMFILR